MKIDRRSPQVKSSGTTDIVAAKRFAEEFYAECLIRSRYGDNPPFGPNKQHRLSAASTSSQTSDGIQGQ